MGANRFLAVPSPHGRLVLRAWLAAELGCARRAVRLQRGDAARRKAVEIDLPAAAVAEWLARVVVAAAAKTP